MDWITRIWLIASCEGRTYLDGIVQLGVRTLLISRESNGSTAYAENAGWKREEWMSSKPCCGVRARLTLTPWLKLVRTWASIDVNGIDNVFC